MSSEPVWMSAAECERWLQQRAEAIVFVGAFGFELLAHPKLCFELREPLGAEGFRLSLMRGDLLVGQVSVSGIGSVSATAKDEALTELCLYSPEGALVVQVMVAHPYDGPSARLPSEWN